MSRLGEALPWALASAFCTVVAVVAARPRPKPIPAPITDTSGLADVDLSLPLTMPITGTMEMARLKELYPPVPWETIEWPDSLRRRQCLTCDRIWLDSWLPYGGKCPFDGEATKWLD